MRQMRCKWNYFRGADPRSHCRMGSFTSSFVRYPVMVYTSTLGGSWMQGIRFFCSFPMTFVSSLRRGTPITSAAEYSSSMSSVVFSSPWFFFSLTSSVFRFYCCINEIEHSSLDHLFSICTCEAVKSNDQTVYSGWCWRGQHTAQSGNGCCLPHFPNSLPPPLYN